MSSTGAPMPRVGFHVSIWGSEYLLAALSALGQGGFDGIEIYGDTTHVYADRPGEFRDIVEISGVPLGGVLTGGTLTQPEFHDAEEAEWARLLAWTREAGGDYAVYCGGDATKDFESDLAHAAKLLNAVGERARDAGISFCYEPDRRSPFNSLARVQRLSAELDPAVVSFSMNTAQLTQMGVDPTLFLLTQKGRSRVVHLRDLPLDPADDDGDGADVRPGEGRIDLKGVVDTLLSTGFDGWIVGVMRNAYDHPLAVARNMADYYRYELGLEFGG